MPNSPALMAAFLCDYDKANKLLPGNEMHPVKYFNGKAIFMVTVIDYLHNNIGKYIEYSIALAVTRGAKPAPRMLPAVFMKSFNTQMTTMKTVNTTSMKESVNAMEPFAGFFSKELTDTYFKKFL